MLSKKFKIVISILSLLLIFAGIGYPMGYIESKNVFYTLVFSGIILGGVGELLKQKKK